ncbi:serine/threonine protein kinase [Pendulispora brunnea]|uniref:Serine/threonine protein kinase n=2 Tax=Pendulispora brunnea TaxID=2905690 RepID=A0ABZ2KGQ4_9BACT
MAAVYAAEHRNGHRVAIKFLLDHLRHDGDIHHLFSREAYVANQVGHPGAVPVLDDDVDDDGCPFLIMPLLEGETVHANWERANRRLPLGRVGPLMLEVLDILATAHENGIIHRDIKPDNLFLTTKGDVRVLDFGIARAAESSSCTITFTRPMMGTPAFMPPEQALGEHSAIGPHGDCWSAGATIFTLLSGELVHRIDTAHSVIAAAVRPARSLRELMPELPSPMARLVDKALAFDPTDRWPTGREMHDALHAALQESLGEPIEHATARMRTEISAHWSARDEDAVDTQPPAPRPCVVPADNPSGDTFVDPSLAMNAALNEVEINAQNVMTMVFTVFRLVPRIAYRILANHGLGTMRARCDEFLPDGRTWWPLATYLEVLWEIGQTVGPAKVSDIGRRVPDIAPLRKDTADIRHALGQIDVLYHLYHRKNGHLMFDPIAARMTEGIGHYGHHPHPFEKRMTMFCDNPYPCEFDRGLLLGFAARVEPLAFVQHDATAPCRKHGAPGCTYTITW